MEEHVIMVSESELRVASLGPLITANHTLIMKTENTEYLGVEGYALMGAAFEVHSELNGGLSEDEARQRGDGKSERFAPKG